MLATLNLQGTVPAVGSTQSSTERRRSARVSESFPLVIRGSDLLGQPFEERTSTLNFNLHGCRYSSKHHLPKNTWLTIESPKNSARHNVRARVAWIQRPHSVREFFQIAVELESPENIWGLDSPPADWFSEVPSYQRTAETQAEQTEIRAAEEVNSGAIPARPASYMGKPMTDINENSIQDSSLAASGSGNDFTPAPDSPFLRELRAELNRHAEQAVESAAATAQERIRQNADELEHQRRAASDESFQKWKEEFAKTAGGAMDNELDAWRSRLRSEMNLAQAEWSELLQSSLDGSMQRLVEQLSQRSQEVQRGEETRMGERFADLIHPVNEAAAQAGQTLAEIRFGLETQVAAARSSLEDMERSAARIRENSAQFEAAGHDSLNELHRRLENVLDAQTAEMSRRVEAMASGMSQRISPAIEAMGNQQVERAMAQMEAKFAPHLERVPALLRELDARELQTEEGLRLHRERLRQMAENSQRDVASRMVFTLAELQRDFESARTQALAKWNEELDASGVRASHSATEALGQASEWFQQEARSRLQVLVEQALASANTGMDEKVADATHKFEARLGEQANDRVAQVSQHIEGLGNDVAERTKTRLEAAAETAARSFGEVVRGISDQEIDFLGQRSRAAVQDRAQEFERTSTELLGNLEAGARGSLEQFHAQFGAHFESRIAQGRSALASEFSSAMDGYRTERDAHEQHWSAKLNELTEEAEGKYQERLDKAADSWSVSSVRRLNEHGQNVIESLMRSADQTLRDSFAKIFDGMSEMLRERVAANASSAFPPSSNREAGEQPSSHQ
jgi:hypothetical protein